MQNPAAARLQAIMAVMFSAKNERELAIAKKQAKAIANMSDEEIADLQVDEDGTEEE